MVSLASSPAGVAATPKMGSSSLKRRILSSDNEATPLQAKRRRVTFDPEVDVRFLGDENEKSAELVGEEVRRALEKHAAGNTTEYDQLRALLSQKPTSSDAPLSSLLQKYLVALSSNVTLLDHTRKGLVHTIIDCHWVARNEHFLRSYRQLIRSILSVYPGFASAVLSTLVDMFIAPPSVMMRQRDDPPIQRVRIDARVHETLRYIIRQSPMFAQSLASTLSATFPFPTDTSKVHTRYITHILKVAEYCPELKGEILTLIIDKVVKIDVKVQIDMEELDDELEDRLLEESTREPDDDDDESDNESVSSEESVEEEERRLRDIKEGITKLDNIMDLLFAHYDSIFAKGNLEEIDQAFESLLAQFSRIILPTYRSRHSQFLLFHFSQLPGDYTERFVSCMSNIAFNPAQPHLFRVAAAAYLASFMARGAHVSSTIVRGVFDLLCAQLETLRAQHEPTCKGPDLRRYGPYYAISQALLYAFCFRWRDLIVTPDGLPPTDEDIVYHDGDFTWHGSVQNILRLNVQSKLNPLRVIANSITLQFARVAHHLRFLYVFSLIETNKRIRLSVRTNVGYAGVVARETALSMKNGEQGMDAYFPFDPYALPKSKRWLEGDYNEWKPIPGMVEEKNDDEEDDEDDDGEDEESDDDANDDDASTPENHASAPLIIEDEASDEDDSDSGDESEASVQS